MPQKKQRATSMQRRLESIRLLIAWALEALNKAEKCLFIHRALKVIVKVHVDDRIVAGTSEEVWMFFKLVGTELKVKENPAWSQQAQVFLGADFGRIQMEIVGITRDVIVEGSKPGYFRNTLIEAGMEKGSAVVTAGVKSEKTQEADDYIGEEDHKVYRSGGRLQLICISETTRHSLHTEGIR
eukprot:6491037-Amphidinium_carterae.4